MSPHDPTALYAAAVLLLVPESGLSPDAAAVAEARAQLERALAGGAETAAVHALLGHALDRQGEGDAALAHFQAARRLSPDDHVYESYALTLLAERGDEAVALTEIARAAPGRGVDLESLRIELRAAGLPADARTLVRNGFVHARNFFQSALSDEALRLREARAGITPEQSRAWALGDCAALQAELAAAFDVARVPPALTPLAEAAARLGVGDDSCRALLFQALEPAERAQLMAEADRLADAIHRWLDGFGDAPLSLEGAAFLYFLLGIEEQRSRS